MTFDWTVSFGTVLLGFTQVVFAIGAYYGLKADNQRTSNDSAAAYARLASALDLKMLTEQTDRLTATVELKSDLMKLIGAVDTAVKDITHRVSTLESGQDEWTKALRKRTHDLANDLNNLVLKVDRLGRAQ
jgi:hypothetical protein